MVKKILHLEGLFFLLASLYFYQQLQGSWLMFLLLLLTPDISLLGFLKDKKLGAIIYNLGHNYILAIIVAAIGLSINNNFIIELGIILSAHVSFDRFFGFGLKYPTNFKDTHLQKI